MPHFFLKLTPQRSTFAKDMTQAEHEIMQQHVLYYCSLMDAGKVVVYGPVLDPEGVYGVSIVACEDEGEARAIAGKDPAASLNRYEVFPMRAVLPAS